MARSDAETIIRRVDLLTLRIFLAVVEEGQLSRAATREHIVPSAVTKRIQDFEDVVGMPLLYRTPRGTSLTPAGEIVAQHVRTILRDVETMRSDLAAISASVQGRLRICASESVIVEFMAEEIGKFLANFPNVNLELEQEAPPDIPGTIAAFEADVGIFPIFGADHFSESNLNVFEYRVDSLAIIAPCNHPLAQQQRIGLADLANTDLIGLRPHSPLMAHLRTIAVQQGVALNLKFELTSNEAARAMVRAGLGVSLQISSTIGPDDYGSMVAISIDEPWAMRRIFVAWPSNRQLSRPTEALLQQLRLQKPQRKAD